MKPLWLIRLFPKEYLRNSYPNTLDPLRDMDDETTLQAYSQRILNLQQSKDQMNGSIDQGNTEIKEGMIQEKTLNHKHNHSDNKLNN